MRKYKYDLRPSDKDYHKNLSAIRNRRKAYEDQLSKWGEIVKAVIDMYADGKDDPEIAETMTRTTKYKIIKRSKEINYENIL